MDSITMNYFSLILLILVLLCVDIKGLDEACTKNSECDTKGSICIDGQCNCDELSYYNKTECLPYATEYGALCYESAQCEWLGKNSDCSNNRCVCQRSFRWYKGKCQAYVDKGEKCDSNDNCYNGYDLLALVCKSGVCTCNQGFYDRGHDCRRSSNWLNGDCALNIDCKLSLTPFCSLGKCITEEKKIYINDLDDLLDDVEDVLPIYSDLDDTTIPCDNDEECKDMANSLCNIKNNTCGCNEKTHYLYNGNCVPGLRSCSSDDSCNITNSMCFKDTTCICQQGFFSEGGKCIAELGVLDASKSYSKDSECPIKPGLLVDFTCYCKYYWFNDDANRNCVKTMIQSSQTCLTNEWCYAMGPYAYCNSVTSQCSCSHFATFNESTYYCDPIEEPTPDFCLRDSDCMLNEHCVDEKCACIENFARDDENVCVPNIGASCLITGCSHIGNSSCVGGQCICNDNYIGKVSRCLQKAENLLDSCEEQEQCQNIGHAVCGVPEDNEEETIGKKCVCGEQFTAVTDKCYQTRKYGDPCVTESDCILVLNHSYQCRNSICQCPVGRKLTNGYCTSSSIIISANFILLSLAVLKIGVS